MEESLEKWERWLEQSLRLDTGYPKIKVTTSTTLREDVAVTRSGDWFEVEFYAPVRNQPDRFKESYESVLRTIFARSQD